MKSVRNVTSSMFFLREEKTLMTSDGSYIVQTIYRTQPSMTVTAVSDDRTDFQSRASNDVAPMGLGYEHVLNAKLGENAARWANDAVEKLSAKPVEPGQVRPPAAPVEPLAHAARDRRASRPSSTGRMGYEANYAGTSFVAPPEKVLGQLKFGSSVMNIQGDREQPGSLAAIGWDDEAVKPIRFDIIKDGIFVDYQTTREQATMLEWYYKKVGKPVRSYGCSYAQSWADVQFERMPNVSLLPGKNDYVWEDMISQMDKGIAIIGDGSFSIDQQRYNGQFAGQCFYEIKGGKIVGMLKDVAYQFRTPEFWGSMNAHRRAALVPPRRRIRRRQGTARPVERHQPRLRARALQAGQHHQHREESVSSYTAPKSLLTPGGDPHARRGGGDRASARWRLRRRPRRASRSTAPRAPTRGSR